MSLAPFYEIFKKKVAPWVPQGVPKVDQKSRKSMPEVDFCVDGHLERLFHGFLTKKC